MLTEVPDSHDTNIAEMTKDISMGRQGRAEEVALSIYLRISKTAALAHKARDQKVHLRGQVLRIPATCHMDCFPPELELASMEENKDAPLLSKKSV